MIVGSSLVIYMEIQKGASGDSDASDAVKKVMVNYLQLMSLAAELPLQWSVSLNSMFNIFGSVSSAGSNLLIPDCEMTKMKTSEAFYLKQFVFTFAAPFIVFACVAAWQTWWVCCRIMRKAKRVTKETRRDYMVLSIVLMLFLCYPMFVRFCLSMLKCPVIGDNSYLMADLQEPCFEGKHLRLTLLLTLPQLVLYVIGLPLMALIKIMRNAKSLNKKHFAMRYGLLYTGYRPGREWWEMLVVIRKVTIVAVGTFGSFLPVIDLQAFAALMIIFVSLVCHLVGKPFDQTEKSMRRLHNLEFAALTIAFITFWGGLMFHIGDKLATTEAKIETWERISTVLSIFLVGTNVLFLACSVFYFVHVYSREAKAKRRRRISAGKGAAMLPTTTVAPRTAVIGDGGAKSTPSEALRKWSLK